ncbi:hypothetical protein V8F33_007551 [Rhypophila sp. PSN 637]
MDSPVISAYYFEEDSRSERLLSFQGIWNELSATPGPFHDKRSFIATLLLLAFPCGPYVISPTAIPGTADSYRRSFLIPFHPGSASEFDVTASMLINQATYSSTANEKPKNGPQSGKQRTTETNHDVTHVNSAEIRCFYMKVGTGSATVSARFGARLCRRPGRHSPGPGTILDGQSARERQNPHLIRDSSFKITQVQKHFGTTSNAITRHHKTDSPIKPNRVEREIPTFIDLSPEE